VKRLLARGSGPMLVWGLILTALWVVGWSVFATDTTTVALGAWMGGSVLAWAAWTWTRERRAGRAADAELGAVIDGSHATALLGLAIVCALLATVFGPWLAYVAAGMALVALGGLVREHRASRAALEHVEGRRR
jgi:hypothetical protein